MVKICRNIRCILGATNLLIVISALLVVCSCASPTKVVQDLTPPSVPTLDMGKFIAPETHQKRFVPKSGSGSITKDNVTVKIADIINNTTDDRFSTLIEGPLRHKYRVGISPMMLVLEIENNTDHIITLRRTIIRIENESQQECPLIKSLDASKSQLVKRVSRAYDQYLANVSADFKEVVYGEYSERHSKFAQELREASKKSSTDSLVSGLLGSSRKIADVRTSDMPAGRVLTEYGIADKITKKSPDYVYKNGIVYLTGEIQNSRSKAIQQIENQIQIDEKNIITSGVYQPISILPRRTARIVAPFCKPHHSKEMNALSVGIYDLPTKVNQAGDPIKRENFIYDMIATAN